MRNNYKFALVLLIVFSSFAVRCSNTKGDLIIDVIESGGDVTFSFSGTLDGTFTSPPNFALLQTAFNPSAGTLRFNRDNAGIFQPVRFDVDGPISVFGPGGAATPSSVTGDRFLIEKQLGNTVIVDNGVVPGVTNLSGQMTFSETTIAELGVDLSGGPITVATIAGSGDTIIMRASAVPEPNALFLLCAAIVGCFLRRSRSF